ncbi:MAG: glutathione S-transferase family protein [Candidatus Eremiobacteraeota bacterium]|nr:glutathione S-transferase family protein [Candidatus Eremiobacteraeota bacterium]
MSMKIWYHPLDISSQMAVLALFECGADFQACSIEEAGEKERTAFLKRWPTGQLPVLLDDNWDDQIFGSSVIAEYLHVYGGFPSELLPDDQEEAREVRSLTRFVATGLAWPMSLIWKEQLSLPSWVEPGELEWKLAARRREESLPILEARLAGRSGWLAGNTFSLADCQAAPALLCYEAAQELNPYPRLREYLDRCWQRPAFQQMLRLVGERFLRYGNFLSPSLKHRLRQAKVI